MRLSLIAWKAMLKRIFRTQSHRDTEVGLQQTSVKDVFVTFTICPLLSRSPAKSVSPEMWGIKRPEATVATYIVAFDSAKESLLSIDFHKTFASEATDVF